MRRLLCGWLCVGAILSCGLMESLAGDRKPPNIVWLSCEDISAHLGCYGDTRAVTPHLDALAAQGVRYSHAFTAAGVCAPCRSTIITGMYQTSIGTHHMRCNATLPDTIRAFPHYLRDAGYYCTNNSKRDYQFRPPSSPWDRNGKVDWSRRRPGQPFFAVFNFTGCHESGIASESKYRKVSSVLAADQRQSVEQLELPPYYPDTPVTREDWKRYYELITAMDHWVGGLIQRLKDEGLYEQTIIMYWSDHGVGLPRAKRWLYDSGTRIPLIVRIPEALRVAGQGVPGSVEARLVSSVDFAPTVLNLAGVAVPSHMQGQAFLGPNLPAARPYVFGARDRMDERYDIIRSVRDQRFRYIRNYEPLKAYYQYMNTPEKGATMRELRRVHAAGALPPAAELFMAGSKPVEELYDLEADPHEIHNLAGDRRHAKTLERLRKAHRTWVLDTRDLGLIPEPLLVAYRRQFGSEFAILRQPGGAELNQKLARIAALASRGPAALPELKQATADGEPAIRYWAATGIGNIGPGAAGAAQLMEAALADDQAVVRVAAARALCRMDRPGKAVPTLIQELGHDDGWLRLHAAIVLDSIGEQARPAVPALQRALSDQPNKYITRVANHTLNALLGTNNVVR